MDMDGPLKVLFRKYARDLLGLTGDQRAEVLGAGPVELHALKRTADQLLELKRHGLRYYRHLELQRRPDSQMPRRLFEYNALLNLQLDAPVLSTAVYLFPPRPRYEPVYRLMLGDEELNRWRFGAVHLWEIDVSVAFDSALPGLLALVPLLRGGSGLDVIEAAARAIEKALPEERLPEAEAILLWLAGRAYNVSELSRVIGRERMMESSWYQEALAEGQTKGRAEGRTEGRAEGRLEAERETCLELLRELHPALVPAAAPVVAACSDFDQLKRWVLSIPKASAQDVARALGLGQ